MGNEQLKIISKDDSDYKQVYAFQVFLFNLSENTKKVFPDKEVSKIL